MTAPKPPTLPWDHPYESGKDSMACLTCGFVGSYAHSEEFYRKWVFPSFGRAAQLAPDPNPYARLEEPPFGHHIKGQPDEGEWRCTCGYGDMEDEFDTAEQHIANVVLQARESGGEP